MVGQDILHDEFARVHLPLDVEGMKNKDVSELKSKIENTDHVASVIWYDSIADVTVPMELLLMICTIHSILAIPLLWQYFLTIPLRRIQLLTC
jgi:hypothetical protein